jgi:hypothetical protein
MTATAETDLGCFQKHDIDAILRQTKRSRQAL